MPECHAAKCSRDATMRLRIGNNHTYRHRWTSGLDYCDEHAERVGWSLSDKGLRVLVAPIGRKGRVLMGKGTRTVRKAAAERERWLRRQERPKPRRKNGGFVLDGAPRPVGPGRTRAGG